MKLTYGSSKKYPITKTFTADEDATGEATRTITGHHAVDRVSDYLTALSLERAHEMTEEGKVTLHTDLDDLVIQMSTALEALRTIAELDGTGDSRTVAIAALQRMED